MYELLDPFFLRLPPLPVIPDSAPSFILLCHSRESGNLLSSVLTLIIIIIKLIQKGLAVSKVVSAMDMRQNFGTLLNQVAIKDEEIVIERAGKPLARLVSMNSATSGKLDFRDIGKLPNDIWNEP
jgi:prevent-host-death family protein